MAEFNKNVAKKYSLLKRPGDGFSNEEISNVVHFGKFTTLGEKITLLAASKYPELDMPEELIVKVAEAYANVQNTAGDKIDIKDCIPKKNLDELDLLELKKQSPMLHKLYIKSLN